MSGEVDQFRGFPYPADDRLLNGVAFSDERDHAAVVVGVHLTVEEVDAGNFHGVDNGVDDRFIATLGKIRDTFDKSAGHTREG